MYPGSESPVTLLLSSSTVPLFAVKSSTVDPSGRTMVTFLSDPSGVYVCEVVPIGSLGLMLSFLEVSGLPVGDP